MVLPEIAKSANILLNAFEPSYLWIFLSQRLKKASEAQQAERYGTAWHAYMLTISFSIIFERY